MAETWRRFRKTPTMVKNPFDPDGEKVPRSTVYIQFNEFGEKICELTVEDDSLAELTMEERHELIGAMHRMDDRECDTNNAENRLDPITKAAYDRAAEKFAEEFEKEHGRAPRKEEYPDGGHRTLISTQAMSESQDNDSDDMSGDKSKYEAMMATPDFADIPEGTVAETICNAMSDELTDREKQALLLTEVECLSNKKAGEVMGISGQRVGQLHDSAIAKLKENPSLRRCVRFF